jgi:hypothetical protein
VCILCLAFIWRHQIWNGFSLLQGDRYDAVIQASILEHWHSVLRGAAHWSDAGYFYPYKMTIAQTDAFFLVGLIYAPLRWIGADPFLAAELSGVVLKAVGFFAMYALMRRALKVSIYWALLAAVLFTLNNAMTAHGQRLQLDSVAFAPLLALLMWEAWSAFMQTDRRRLLTYGSAAGLLYGAWCMTCFYMSWFFGFFALFAICFGIAMAGPERRSLYWTSALRQRHTLLAVLGIALLALTPFVYAFGYKWLESGARSYGTVRQNTVPIWGILDVGTANLLLGEFYYRVASSIFPGYSTQGEYYNTGCAIALFIVFAFSCAHFMRKRAQSDANALLAALSLATLMSWLFTLRIAGVSLWKIVFMIVPGAAALNVVAQYQIFLAFPIVLISTACLSTRQLGYWAIPLAALLVAEEANTSALHLDRAAELARAAIPNAPPADCRAFYVSGWRDQENITNDGTAMPTDPQGRSARKWLNNAYAHNVSAMFIAQLVGLPTLNGFNSFNPPDWNSTHLNRPDYDQRMHVYAERHSITEGLCRLDLNTKTWSKGYRHREPPVADPNVIDFRRSSWDGVIKSVRQLSHAETWGTWSDGAQPTIELSRPFPPRFDLVITAHAFGPNVGMPIGVRAGEGAVHSVTLKGEPEQRTISLENPGNSSVLTFVIPSPTSPKSLSQGTDERGLGVGFTELRIVPQP